MTGAMRGMVVMAAVVSVAAGAGPTAASTPLLGHVTRNGAVHAVAGVRTHPGLSGALTGIDGASAVAGEWVLASTDGAWRLVSVLEGRVRPLEVRGTLLAVSPAGRSALFVDEGRMVVVKLDGDARNSVIGAAPEGLLAAAVNDGGDRVLAGVPGSVLEIRADAAATTVLRATEPRSIAWLKDGRALVVDSSEGRVLRTDGAVLASDLGGVAGVVVSEDAGIAIAFSGDAQRVVAVPLGAGGVVRTVECGFRPERVERLRDDRTFVVWSAEGTASILQTGGAGLQLSFVPEAEQR